jgi:hypothetical protein
MSKYKYKLTLEVEDCGHRTFTSEGEFDSQSDMKDAIPWDVAKALQATFTFPPDLIELAEAMETDCLSLISGLAYAHRMWNGEEDFDDCMNAVVVMDVAKLCGTEDADKKEAVEKTLKLYGIESKK